ncbi:P-loop containing nucleoside triphosphate hydrolase protein [Panaeolus papilionaceus]|nr:P-loop containing nucleoside triphosphate hydrolase protein [Panaeolus papilionaceus]
MRLGMCALRSVYGVGGRTCIITAAHESNDAFQYVSDACTTARRPPHIPSDAQQRLQWLSHIISFFSSVLASISQILLIFHLSRTTGGPIFAILCILRPVVGLLGTKSMWDKACYGYVNNVDYVRMKSLTDFVGGTYRQDIISGNLGEWIMSEFKKAYDKLANVTVEHPYMLYDRTETPFRDMMLKALGDLPMVYCALLTILRPSHFSLSSLAILQQSSAWLGYSLGTVFQSTETFRQAVMSVRKLYEAGNVVNKLSDGVVAYPAPEDEKAGKGMGFELKNVTFTYPGSQSKQNALSDISLSIKHNQLVVIVGTNGSGKSTLIRILSRLYDPTSGEVCIDGRASSSYRVGDLHKATAILSQDNSLYPLTLAENIGIGFPERSSDMDLIRQAAEEGGAVDVIKKLEDGYETRLDPMQESFSVNLYNDKQHPLAKELEGLRKPIDVSGGEKQKLVAARTFMRFHSNLIKFVAVDEPSSALDAEAELRLFQRLIKAREGKTMVFVTHRFGGLVKEADLVVCMKDGTIAEIGTHEELMKKDGEYAKLYNIQANAFAPGGGVSEGVASA